MKRILIADASKASLVMTSEVFKDHFPGVQVVVARTAAECLELVKTTENIDAYVIDFDLPDRDGAWTAARVKKQTQTPVLITAFDKPEVVEVIEQELAAYDDCLAWLRKPVKAELVVSVAQRFCEGRYRTQRRVACAIPALAEIVVNTTITRTVKETLKAAPKAASAKASAKAPLKAAQDSKSKTEPKGTKGKSVAEPAAKSATKAVAKEPSTVTKTIKETVQTKMLVPAKVMDSSLGGIKVEVDLSGLAHSGAVKSKEGELTWSVKPGEVISIQLPPTEMLEAADTAAWSEWQSERLERAKDAAKGTKKGAALSTLSGKTLRATTKPGTSKTDATSLSVRGKACWVQEGETSVAFGLELDNPTQAKRIFEAALNGHNALRRAAAQGHAAALHAATPTKPNASRTGGRNHS